MSIHIRQRGFTLFEMVIAVAIFALMGVLAFAGLGQMTRSGQAVAEANARLSELQFAVVYFKRDWTQVSPRMIRNQYGDVESNIVLEDDVITFTRSGWHNLLGHKRSNLQRVQYLMVDNELRRRYWFSLDQGIGEEPLEAVLLKGVKSMRVTFVDARGKDVEQWPQVTNSSTATGKPIMLSLSLDLDKMGEIKRLLEIPDGLL